MKRTWKQIGSLILALCVMLTMLPGVALAEGSDITINETNFPDENFRNWLLDSANIDGKGADRTLTALELTSITEINVESKNIADLTGIEHFTALAVLCCSNNLLTTLPELPSGLTELLCSGNLLTTLSELPSGLTELYCGRNQITALPATLPTGLTYLDCYMNQLTALPTPLPEDLGVLDCNDNQLTELPVLPSTLTELICFKNQLTTLPTLPSDLTTLNCHNNQLTTLNVSSLDSLEYCNASYQTVSLTLTGSGNSYTKTIALNNPTNLSSGLSYVGSVLISDDTKPSSSPFTVETGNSAYKLSGVLNLTYQTSSTELTFTDSAVYDIPASTIGTAITNINVAPDVSGGTVPYKFSATGLPAGIVISETGVISGTPTVVTGAGTATITVTDSATPPAAKSITIAYGAISVDSSGTNITADFTDPNFLAAVRTALGKGVSGPIYDTDNFASVKKLDISNKNISSLAGIEHFSALTELRCEYNKLPTLDVSRNTALETLICEYNHLTMLDVSNNAKLNWLACSNNYMLKEGAIKGLDKNLTIDFIFEPQNAGAPPTDITAKFTDSKFLEAVRDELSIAASDPVYDTDVASVTELYVSSKNISNLAGIEYFSALTVLNCNDNQLITLDLSSNTSLTELSCSENQLTSLDVSKNTALTALECDSNQLTRLGVSQNTALNTLKCDSNQLTALDVSRNTVLEWLKCNSNQLTTLDVSRNTVLDWLECSGNKLTTLDISSNTALHTLNCGSNRMTTLDVSNNTDLYDFYCSNNYMSDENAIKGLDKNRPPQFTFLPQNPGIPPIEITGFEPIPNENVGKAGSTICADVAEVRNLLQMSHPYAIATHTDPPALWLITGWEDTDGYNPAVAGSYTFTATIGSVPAGYDNSAGHTVTVEVVVSPADDDNDDNSDNNGGGSSSGGSTTPPTPPAPPAPTVSGSKATTTVTTTTGTDGKAVASVPVAQIDSALKQAQAEAAKSGEAPRVEIKVEAPANAKTVETAVPQAAMTAIASGKLQDMTISSPVANLTFDGAAMNTIAGAAAGDVKFSASKVDTANLPATVQTLIGNRPVYEFSVTSGGNTISQFGGNVTVAVPYQLGAGEDPNAVIISFINADGNLEIVTNGRYDAGRMGEQSAGLTTSPATGTVVFTTNHFSKYAIGYKKIDFTDVADSAWYVDAVTFLAARGITGGTTATTFSPDAMLTRGQFITLLMRTYDIAADENTADNFSDAGNTYYTGYLAAAKRLGIAGGVGDNKFAPEQAITRQEMFTMLYNALKALNKLPVGDSGKTLADFSDSDDVETWALEALTALTKSGTVTGNGGKLDPTGSSTRSQMAQVLYNLLGK